ncbi:MAG: hypothetical protein GY839_01520 [candidate division Zixibacteria bacterium]|nr:hypothetical protein [candidate division Zixibacteria bacterium]
MTKSIVGDLVGKRGIVYSPVNRAGVLLIFARLLDEFDMLVEEIADDCGFVIVRRRVDAGWERVKISLSFKSSEFSNGSPDDGDLLICWHHDWPDCPLKTFELKALFENNLDDNKADDQNSEIDNINENRIKSNPGSPSKDDNSAVISISDIMPSDSGELLEKRGVTRQRFEKAIGDLDDKIKKIFPDDT